jgi:hypothetical protein
MKKVMYQNLPSDIPQKHKNVREVTFWRVRIEQSTSQINMTPNPLTVILSKRDFERNFNQAELWLKDSTKLMG